MRFNMSLWCGQTFLCRPVVAIFVFNFKDILSNIRKILLVKYSLSFHPFLNCTNQTTFRRSGIFIDFAGHPLSFSLPIFQLKKI